MPRRCLKLFLKSIRKTIPAFKPDRVRNLFNRKVRFLQFAFGLLKTYTQPILMYSLFKNHFKPGFQFKFIDAHLLSEVCDLKIYFWIIINDLLSSENVGDVVIFDLSSCR